MMREARVEGRSNSPSSLTVNPLLPFDRAVCSSFAVMSPLLSVSTLSQSNDTTMHAFLSSATGIHQHAPGGHSRAT